MAYSAFRSVRMTPDNYLCYKSALARGQAKSTPAQKTLQDQLGTLTYQFGTHPLTVVKPVGLFEPSAKVLGSGGTSTVDTTDVDHFECYKVVPAKGTPRFVPPSPVAVADEFGRVRFMVWSSVVRHSPHGVLTMVTQVP